MGTCRILHTVFFLLATAAAQQGAGDLFTVEGIVVNSATGKPIPRVLVQLSNRAVLSGREGEFSFDAVSAGQAQIMARKPGFFAPGWKQIQFFRLIEVGPETGKVVLKLAPEAVIFGHVTGADDEPLEGALIEVLALLPVNGRMQPHLTGAMARTDGEGNYRVGGLAPGRYYVAVRSDNLDRRIPGAQAAKRSEAYPLIVYHPQSEDLDSAAAMDLSPGERAEASFSLARQPAFRLAGTVARVGEWKQVNAPAIVDAMDMELRAADSFDPQSGSFEFRALPAGDYRLRCSGTYANGRYEFSDRTVTVSQPVTNLRLTLKRGASIPVEFRTELAQPRSALTCHYAMGGESHSSDCSDLPAAHVELTLDTPASVRFALEWRPPQDASGFTIHGVPAGKYIVHANPAFGYIQSLRSGGHDLFREELVVPEEGNVAPIEVIVRDDAARMNVVVRGSARGQLATVLVVPEDGLAPAIVVGPTYDQVQTGALAPGAYKVLALDTVNGLAYANTESLAPYLDKAVDVRLAANQNANVTVEVVRTGE